MYQRNFKFNYWLGSFDMVHVSENEKTSPMKSQKRLLSILRSRGPSMSNFYVPMVQYRQGHGGRQVGVGR